MITEELLSYIKKQLEAGHSEETIRKILVDHKWKSTDVDQAFSTVLGVKPQNTQGEIASIMRPGFSGTQVGVNPQVQPQIQQIQTQPVQTAQFSQPQIQTQPQFQPQPQIIQNIQPQQSQPAQPIQTQPQFVQFQQIQPQVTPVTQPQPVQNLKPVEFKPAEPIQQPVQETIQEEPKIEQKPVVGGREEIKLNPILQKIEAAQKQEIQFQKPIKPKPEFANIKVEDPDVFMPKTFVNAKPNFPIQNQTPLIAKVEPVKETIADPTSDFYKSLTQDSAETPNLNIVGPEATIIEEKTTGDFMKKPVVVDNGRPIGQSFLKPKVFPARSSTVTDQIRNLEPVTYAKFATPEAHENLPTLNKNINPPVGQNPSDLYQKVRPDQLTMKESQAKMPTNLSAQPSPNIVDRPMVETNKGRGTFLKKLSIFFILLVAIGFGFLAYIKFFKGGISKDSGFMKNFQTVQSADFEVSLSGPILATIIPSGDDPSLLTGKMKAYIDVSEASNKISNFEIDLKNGKEINFNVLSTSASTFAYTTYEEFDYKNQWIQLNGPFIQAFVPTLLTGGLPNRLVTDSGSVLPDASTLRIRELWSQFDILDLIYEKENEEINGKSVKVYNFTMNKAVLDLYFDEVLVLAKGSAVYESSIKKLKEILNTVEVKEGTIWIGDDGLPYRVVATLNTLGSSVTSQLSIEVNSYNERKNVSLPDNFVRPEVGASGNSFAEGELKDSIRQIFVDLQSIAGAYSAAKNGSYSGLCEDTTSGFLGRFSEVNTLAPDVDPVCKASAQGFVIGAKYSGNKYLCADKGKISESDSASIASASTSCVASSEAMAEDNYLKESITAFGNIAKTYKSENQNFGGLCASSSFGFFNKGLQSAVGQSPQCISTNTGFAVFGELSSGDFACIDATYKYTVSEAARTTASCK